MRVSGVIAPYLAEIITTDDDARFFALALSDGQSRAW